MSDEQKAGAGDGQPPSADVPDEMVLRVHGKDVPMPTSKVVTLAQQGLNQARAQEQLAADRTALEQDSTRYEEYKRLRAHLDANPLVAKAVAQAVQDPQSVLSPSAHRDGDADDYDDDQPQRQEQRSTPELDDLRRQVAELSARDKQRDAAEATTLQGTRIDSEVSEYPWLEKGRIRDVAKSQIAAVMANDPRADLASVTAVIADDMKSMLEEVRTDSASRVSARRRLQTDKPSRGTPGVIPKEAPTKNDLENGNLLKLTKDAARAFGLPVD
tara:strand:+ start:434 stop:1249 length:816 start_codon:yes stop_codon:yes gene_type:complete